MHMRVEPPGGQNEPLPPYSLRVHPHHHARGDALHTVRVARLPDADDVGALEANVRLVDAGVVYDQRVGDHHVQGTVRAHSCRLPHALAQGLPAAELALVAVRAQVLLHLQHEGRVSKPHLM
eukprot:147611-Prorocentrum_minimum.AAC.2